ncbi:MAG: uracil phosphoribosyltransferase [Flavobacteriales bacterium]
MVHELSRQNSALSAFVAELRDEQIQQDRMRFRRNLERIGFCLALEMSKQFPFTEKSITTPLGEADAHVFSEQPVAATILRAGLPMHQGVLDVFDHADNAFVSAYRKYQDDGEFNIEIEYLSSPSLQDRILVICDPMIATGSSVELAFRALLRKGMPKQIHVLSAIASQPGLNYLKQHLPENTQYWVADIDAELTARSYIVPGLGDAGDLAFGTKV